MTVNVLVLGGSGLLGSAVVRVLAEAGDQVTWTSRMPPATLPGRPFSFHVGRTPAEQDTALGDLLAAAAPEYIVDCLRGRDADPRELLAVNALFPFRLAAKAMCPFLYVSTNAVFQRAAREWTVADNPCPDTVYGFSKLLGEQAGARVVFRTTFVGLPPRSRPAPSWAVGRRQPDCLWNGVTVLEAARAIRRAVHEEWAGVVHQAGNPGPWRNVVRRLHRLAAEVGYPVEVALSDTTFTDADPLLLHPTATCRRPLKEQFAEYAEFLRRGGTG